MQLAPVIYFSSIRLPDLADSKIFENVYVIGTSHSGFAPRSVIAVHGCGVVNGQLITNSVDAAQAISGLQGHRLSDIGEKMKGSLTLYVVEGHQQCVTVLADPLGGGLVFMHRDSDGCAISSDLRSLVSFLRRIGKEPRKSLNYLAAYVATGSGGLVPASYEDIDVLPQFSYIEVCPQGVSILDYNCKTDFFNNDMPYQDALQATRVEISANISAMASAANPRKVAHLTGGVDSRIVLGALIHAGVQDEFSFYCSGGSTAPDQIIAKKLAAEYSLTMTVNSGLESNWVPESLEQQLLLPFIETSGIISGVAQEGNSPSSTLVASGGYGELFRSFYNKGSQEASTAASAEKMFGRTAFSSNSRRRIFSDQFVDTSLHSLELGFREARDLGVRSDAELDYIYFSRRNRYYVGEISRSVSKYSARFDPLYSLHGASLGLRVDNLSRDANIIGFDLLNHFDNRLSLLPFDSDKYSGSYERIRTIPSSVDFKSSAVVNYDNVKRLAPTNQASIPHSKPSKADTDRANKLRMSPRLVMQGAQIQKGAKELLRGLPQDQTRRFFNESTSRLLLNEVPSHRAYYRSARDLYAGLLWFTSS